MTKTLLIQYLILISFGSKAQTRQDTLNSFKLTYVSQGTTRGYKTIIEFKDPGKMTVIITSDYSKKPEYKKTITVDKSSFTEIKHKIVNEYKLLSLSDTINCTSCRDGSYEKLNVKFNKTNKYSGGYNPSLESKKYRELIEYMDELVGRNEMQ
jgi:hypothetical protein